MVDIWFSSDPHFFHEKIIKYCGRPFKDAAEMNEVIIERHNKVVKPWDHWYCLGDVTMLRDNQGRGLGIVKRLQGHRRLILGNHDHYEMKHYLKVFEKVMAMHMIDGIRFTHIPVHPSAMGRSIANVHGHIHEKKSPEPVIWLDSEKRVKIAPYINISLEVTNYTPIHFDELKRQIESIRGEHEGTKIGDEVK